MVKESPLLVVSARIIPHDFTVEVTWPVAPPALRMPMDAGQRGATAGWLIKPKDV